MHVDLNQWTTFVCMYTEDTKTQIVYMRIIAIQAMEFFRKVSTCLPLQRKQHDLI